MLRPLSLVLWFWLVFCWSWVVMVFFVFFLCCLAISYCPNIDIAFNRVRHICREVNYGWQLRTPHANGASLFFVCIYVFTHRAKFIVRIIQVHKHVVSRGSNPILNHSNSIHRIRITMRKNIILRCNFNYKPSSCIPVRRKGISSLSMRRVRGWYHLQSQQ